MFVFWEKLWLDNLALRLTDLNYLISTFLNVLSPIESLPHIQRIMPHCVPISANALNGFKAAFLFSTMWSKWFKVTFKSFLTSRPQKHIILFCLPVKFIYSEKTTKFCKIFTLLLTVSTAVKSKVKISQNVVVFSEYMNFNIQTRKEYDAKIRICTVHRVLELSPLRTQCRARFPSGISTQSLCGCSSVAR